MSSPFYAKGDPGAPVDQVIQNDREMTFLVQGNEIGTVDLPPYNPIIVHGDDPDVDRIDGIGSSIVWVGSVEPNNAVDGDLWADISGDAASIITTTLSSLNVGAPITQQLVAVGDDPIVWALDSGAIPDGLTISTAGNLYGTPTTSGAYDFTVVATNGFGSDTQQYTGTVGAAIAPTITTTSLGTVSEGVAFSLTIASTGSLPITWTVQSGSLPAGLSINSSTGAITGTPSSVGAYSFTLRATNSVSYDDQAFSGSVTGIAPTITTTTLGTLWRAFAVSGLTIVASGSASISFSVTTGSLPAGLSLNGSTGAITGTPTTIGAYSFVITASNAYSPDDTQSFSGSVLQSTPVIVETSLNSMTVSSAFSQTLTLTTGGPTITWSVQSGSLPAGLSLNSSTGAITGTPTTSGSYSATIRATNGTDYDDQAFTGSVTGLPVAYRASSAVGQGPTSSSTRSLTISATVGDTILIGIETTSAVTVSSLTYSAGDTVSSVGSVANGNTSGFGSLFVYQIASLSASGGTLSLTMSGSTTLTMVALAYDNVGSITGVTTSYDVSTSITTSATNVTDGMVVGFLGSGQTLSAISSGTSRINQTNLAVGDSASSGSQTVAAPVVFSQNADLVLVLNP